MNLSHVLHKMNKKINVKISVRVLAIFYLLFLIGHQLQTPTTAYYSNSNTVNGTLAAMNDFGEIEMNSMLESTEAEELEVKEDVEESNEEENKEEINEEEIKEEANEELSEEENIEEIKEEVIEEKNTEINDSNNKSDSEENVEN